MRQLVEYRVGDGSQTVLVEVDEPVGVGEERASLRDRTIRADQRIEDALERVRPAVGALLETVQGLDLTPDEIEVEFGIKLTARAGAVLAAAGVEANYRVTLSWKRT